jgi:hypothetical protein
MVDVVMDCPLVGGFGFGFGFGALSLTLKAIL